MPLVRHRFGDFLPQGVRRVFLGTFNPDAPCNPAEFYYSRRQNHFWRLLPEVYGLLSLRNAAVTEKKAFATELKVGFIDLIRSLDVPFGGECRYEDAYIDGKVAEWNDVPTLISNQKSIEHVLFTRRSFVDIPNIQNRINEIHALCKAKEIKFSLLPTPARIYSVEKLKIWKSELLGEGI